MLRRLKLCDLGTSVVGLCLELWLNRINSSLASPNAGKDERGNDIKCVGCEVADAKDADGRKVIGHDLVDECWVFQPLDQVV